MKALRVLLTGLSVLLPAVAAAQDFPSKPIRLIVPFPPGGPNDIIARLVGQRMSEITKQPVLIDNRGGQAGVLGTDAIAKAAPDGYTIGIVSASSLVINPTMEKVPYDVTKDFAPVTLVTTVPEMLVVASNVPAGDMKELVALAKAQPGKLNFASAGVGGLPHLAGELLKLTARIDIVHVPYRGAAPAINDLLGQQVQMAFLDLPVLLPHIKAGTLRPIALGAPKRAPTSPDVPTTAEVGMPDLLIENWYGMIAPGGTPETIVTTLNRVANEAMNDPQVKQKLADQGLTVAGDTPEHFRDYIGSRDPEMGAASSRPPASRRGEMTSRQRASTRRGFAQMLRQLLRRPGQRSKAPRADHEPPVGPGIPDPDDIDLHRSRASFCRDFRHHANPDAGGDHLADRIETVQPRAKAQTRAEPRRVSADMGVQRDRADQSDEIALHHFAEIDLPPVRQFVLARGDQHQTVFAERDPLDIVCKRVFGGEPEIGGAGHDGAGDVGAFAFLDVDRNVRMRGQKGSQRLRQIFRKPRRVGEEADGGLRAAGKGGQIAAHRLDIVEHDPGVIEQAFAGRRQLDAASAARQQRYAERLFQSLDPLARRGQREMNCCRAVGDAARLGHRDEELKIDQIEAHRDLSTLMVRRPSLRASRTMRPGSIARGHPSRRAPCALLRMRTTYAGHSLRLSRRLSP